jgi:peptide subunit release factor 1 (eRF1)
VIVVACHHQDLFEPVPVDVPVATEVSVGPVPSLGKLVHAAEDFPAYAVLTADQREAILWLMEGQTWERSVQLEADDYPRKQKQGGWSQRRYQARADERVEAFAKTIAEEARRELGEGDEAILYVIVAADEPMSSALAAEFHETVSDRIIGHVTLPNDANDTQVAEAAEPLVAQAERQQELEAVQAVRDGVGAGTLGVAGPADTLTALQTGQVLTLVMNDDFSRPGWADYALPLYGVGEAPSEHPAGGDVRDIVPTALEDEVIRLAIQTGASIELVRTAVPVGQTDLDHVPDADDPTPRTEAAKALDELGGIGAILRYSIDEDQNEDSEEA